MATATTTTAPQNHFFAFLEGLVADLGKGATYLGALKFLLAVGQSIPAGQASPAVGLMLAGASLVENKIEAHLAENAQSAPVGLLPATDLQAGGANPAAEGVSVPGVV